MNPAILQEVILLIAEETGVQPSRINAATRISEDLRVEGDDASDLLTAFASRFHVDLAEFQFDRHFGPEMGWNPLYALYCLFAGCIRTEAVTVGQLTDAAEKGVWRYVA